jgi:DNA adenine methylase
MQSKRQKSLTLSDSFEEALDRLARVTPGELVEPIEDTSEKKPYPFIKWAGGKRHLAEELIKRLPTDFSNYYESFVGGAALFFSILEQAKKTMLSDSNLELVIAYNVIKKEPEKLIQQLEEHTKNHNESYYYRVRNQHQLQNPIEVAARFIYLNKTCYNGLYRVNKKGEFNVPVGRYSNPTIYDKSNIMAVHKALRIASIEYRDFETINPEANDFVYCDPPYHPVSQTASFTGYTKSDFTEADQTRLRDFAVKLHKEGVFVMVSNSDTPFIRDLYSESCFNITVVQAPRFVNCKPANRGLINELLITNY